MILRVNFHDNDFSYVVEQACNSIMDNIVRGHKGNDAIQMYEEARDRHDIENIRKAIVLASYGFLIARECSQVYNKIDYESIYGDNCLLGYLDDCIKIEEITDFLNKNEDSSVCYIYFYNKCVYLQ